MDRHYYEKVFSTERMQKYFQRFPADEHRAIELYKANIAVSEAFYPILAVFEVALRNSLNRELKEFFGSEDWYLRVDGYPGLKDLRNEINLAKKHITKRNETITGSKVVAELTLGFWVRLLNAEYEKTLWKPLRKAFPFMNKNERQRGKVSAPINHIRSLRNRIFHHEPITWNLTNLERTHQDILIVLAWINKDLPVEVAKIDRVPEIVEKIKQNIYQK